MADEPPEAEPFAALGAGNGFPACVPRLDVDDYDYWTTLGGFNKNSGGSPTELQLAKSKENAMKLFWNLYGFTGQAQVVSFVFPEEATVTNLTVEDEDDPDLDQTFVITPSDIKQPYQRVCLKDENEIEKLEYSKQYQPGSSGGRLVQLAASMDFYRFYFNDAYIGIGFLGSSGGVSGYTEGITALATNEGIGGEQSMVGLNGVESDPFYSPPVDSEDYAYVTVNGIPFVSSVFAYDPNAGPENVDAANLSASTNFTNATITGLEFYTYP